MALHGTTVITSILGYGIPIEYSLNCYLYNNWKDIIMIYPHLLYLPPLIYLLVLPFLYMFIGPLNATIFISWHAQDPQDPDAPQLRIFINGDLAVGGRSGKLLHPHPPQLGSFEKFLCHGGRAGLEASSKHTKQMVNNLHKFDLILFWIYP